MKREIKFRGKDIETGRWVYGFYTQGKFIDPNIGKEKVRHIIDNGLFNDVDPDTIGQFTGLHDKNGKDVYEGDLLLYCGDIELEVKFHHGGFGYTTKSKSDFLLGGNSNFTFNPDDKDDEFEIIGNIHDSKLEGEK